jgi:NADH-quinone oxidoreductase subunit J
MTIEQLAFLALSGVAVLAALATILARNPIHSAAMLVLCFFNIAGLFVLAGAEFLAAAMVIIYGGAILVLVVFVVMLVRMNDLPEMHAGHPVQMIVAPVVGLAAFLEVLAVVTVAGGVPIGQSGVWTRQAVQAVGGNAQAFGRALYSEYLFPFVVVSLVLLAAAIGAIVLAKPSREEEVDMQLDISLSRARAHTGLRRLERLALERRQREDAAAVANAALDETPEAEALPARPGRDA